MLGERVKSNQSGQLNTLWVAKEDNGIHTKDHSKKKYIQKRGI